MTTSCAPCSVPARPGREMPPRRRLGWATALLALALCGCESVGGGKNPLNALGEMLSSTATLGEMPPKADVRSWPDAETDVLNAWASGLGVVRAPQLQAYVNEVYQRVKQAAGAPEWPGQVYLTPSRALQAASTGAGNVYLSMGWVESLESEDELVAILSHELGHVYANTHKIEGAVVDFNRAATVAGIGILLAKGGLNSSKLPAGVTNFAMAYMLGRDALTPVWSRSEEQEADRIGLLISQKMGYSFVHGYKAFLERQATWEAKENAAQQQRVQALRAQKAASDGSLIDGEQVFEALGIPKLLASLQASHPDSNTRLDRLVEMLAEQPGVVNGEPQTAVWNKALKHKDTAALLQQYGLAFAAEEAMVTGDLAGAASKASQALRSLGVEHALPVYVLAASTAQLRSQSGQARARLPDADDVVQRSLRTAHARAWKNYAWRVDEQKKRGRSSDALATLQQGHAYFAAAPATWPQAITLYGQLGQWKTAKEMASVCVDKFPSYTAMCNNAARTPQEIAQEKRKSEEKAEKVVDKWMKKLK